MKIEDEWEINQRISNMVSNSYLAGAHREDRTKEEKQEATETNIINRKQIIIIIERIIKECKNET